MKSKEILVQLIEYLSAYENECENSEIKMTINDFISFLNLKFQPESTKRDEISGGRDEWRNEFSNLNSNSTDISILVAVMYRYAKGYVKKTMKEKTKKILKI